MDLVLDNPCFTVKKLS